MDTKTYKIKPGYKLRQLGNDSILTAEGSERINCNRMIALNESAAFLWKSVSEMEAFDASRLTSLLLERYEIDEETAERDSEALIVKWLEADIIQEA